MAAVDEAAKRRQVDARRKNQTQTDGAVRIERQSVFVYLGDSGVHAVATVFSLVFRYAAQKQGEAQVVGLAIGRLMQAPRQTNPVLRALGKADLPFLTLKVR